jgi:hypothetical protein
MVLSHLPPVSGPEAALATLIDVPQLEKTTALAPADPMAFNSARRSILLFCPDMADTILPCLR